LELFAWFTEMLIFQAGQLTWEDRAVFLKLLTSAAETSTSAELEEPTQRALIAIRTPQRAVTCADYETLALRADSRVARAKCIPLRKLDERNQAARNAMRPGHVSLVVIPCPGGNEHTLHELILKVGRYIEPRRILTTRVHVVAPRHVDFEVHLHVVAVPGVSARAVVDKARETLEKFFDPLKGGVDLSGWPLGRDVYVSELYLVVSRLTIVDHVSRSVNPHTGARIEEIGVDPAIVDRLDRNPDGDLISLRLTDDELPGKVKISLSGATAAEDSSREL
jgi:Baseplate J-like protein